MRCSSYCTANAYDIDRLAKFLRSEGFEPKFYDDVIHITKEKDSTEECTDIFFFPYGCTIIWGSEEEEDTQILDLLEDYEKRPIHDKIRDESYYLFGEETKINEEEDEIILESDDVLIRLSVSHALSQSVKLTAFEESIAKTIEKTKHLPTELATEGKISLSRKKLSQKIGALFAERNSINLHSDILDTPEFFWRRPKYEHYYHMAAEYLDIQTRHEILNRRLDVIHELYDILSNELKHLHSSRLELTIIFLIVIEVVFIILKDLLKVL